MKNTIVADGDFLYITKVQLLKNYLV